MVNSFMMGFTPSLSQYSSGKAPATLPSYFIDNWVETLEDLQIKLGLEDNFGEALNRVGFIQTKANPIGRGEDRGSLNVDDLQII